VKVGASAVKPTLSAVVLDSSPVWLEAVDDVLSRHGVAVVGRTREADRALELVDHHRPGLLIADSGAGGIECVRGEQACPGPEGDRPWLARRPARDPGGIPGRRGGLRRQGGAW